MDTVEMKAFHMMENREDVAVARATAGMIMMANSKEVMLIKNQADLDAFKKMYGIDGEIEKEY